MSSAFEPSVVVGLDVSSGNVKNPCVLQDGQVTWIFSPGFPWIVKWYLHWGHAIVVTVMCFFTSLPYLFSVFFSSL